MSSRNGRGALLLALLHVLRGNTVQVLYLAENTEQGAEQALNDMLTMNSRGK